MLREPAGELRRREVQASAGADPAAVDGVLARLAQRDQFTAHLQLVELQAGRPAHGRQRVLACLLQRAHEAGDLLARGRAVEAADAGIDGVDRTAAHHLQHAVAGLLQPQAAPDCVRVVTRHLDCAVAAQEVGRMEQVHVQRVTLHPLAAVEEPAKLAQRPVDHDPAGRLDGLGRGELVGHGADAADPRRDVDRLQVRAAAQQRLEVAGRLEDVELQSLHLVPAQPQVERALALHSGEGAHLDSAGARPLSAHCALRP